MVGCKFQSAIECCGKSGAPPYRAMPGRTQSAATAASTPCRRAAALLEVVRSPGKSCAAFSNTCICAVTPVGPSASLKCVITEISSTCGNWFKRVHADRNASGLKPKRFIPLLSFKKTRCACWVLCWLNMSICSVQCTVCHKLRREQSSKSRESNAPSNNKIGPRQPTSRTRWASFKSSNANPSQPRKPS